MILLAIIALSGVVLAVLIGIFVGLPDFPDSVDTYINLALQYMQEGAAFAFSFFYIDVVRVLFGITVTVYGVYTGYKLIMWVIKKIPMLGVQE